MGISRLVPIETKQAQVTEVSNSTAPAMSSEDDQGSTTD